jgi:hypothetical protein
LGKNNTVSFLLSPEEKGLFVFTSAGSVYAENSGGEVDESSELAAGPRSSTLIDAERPVLAKVKDDRKLSSRSSYMSKIPWNDFWIC